MNDIKILDCTLRDGGYYTNWDFDKTLVEKYFFAMSSVGIDFVEIGLRSIKNDSFKGGFAYCTDKFINSLNIPNTLKEKIGVMINASELYHQDLSSESVLESLFDNKKNSPVSLVRIASHYHEIQESLSASRWLKNKGYKVGINLMQIADRSKEELENFSKEAADYDIDALYFADSMGGLYPSDVKSIVSSIKSNYPRDIGIHTHDNMCNALQNSVTAMNNGVTWIDSTITGMGRGPGNLQTENFLLYLQNSGSKNYNLSLLLDLVFEIFIPMQKKFGWGSNPFYFLSGMHSIHPTYIQHMLSDKRFSSEDVLSVIERLKNGKGKSFSLESLNQIQETKNNDSSGSWCPKNNIEGKSILILGTGPSLERYKETIEEFIIQNEVVTLALNTQAQINDSLIDYRVASHPLKIISDHEKYLSFEQPLILPKSLIDEDILSKIKSVNLLDYGLNIKADTFLFNETYCTLPAPFVMLYALAIANSGKAKEIFLAGFDGYQSGDPRNEETMSLFSVYSSINKNLPLTSITPTKYRLKSKSIYGLV